MIKTILKEQFYINFKIKHEDENLWNTILEVYEELQVNLFDSYEEAIEKAREMIELMIQKGVDKEQAMFSIEKFYAVEDDTIPGDVLDENYFGDGIICVEDEETYVVEDEEI